MAVHYSSPPQKELIANELAKDAPFSAIAFIEMIDAGNQGWVGSGSLISAEYVLTAAHVLRGKVAGRASFAYDVNVADNAKRQVAIGAACIPAKYLAQPGWDIGVARLAAPYNGTSKFFFERPTQGVTAQAKTPVTMAGYPGVVQSVSPSEHPQVAIGHLYGKGGTVYGQDVSKNLLQYRFDTRGGESGAPLYVTGAHWQQVAVHTNWAVVDDQQTGQGTLLTSPVLAWVRGAVQALGSLNLATVTPATFVQAL